MTRYAVALSIGPVGDFIASGRRSRDLWYGSRLLSELTQRVAFALEKAAPVVFAMPQRGRLYADHPSRSGSTVVAHPFFPELDEQGEFVHPPVSADERHRKPVISNRVLCTVTAPDEQALLGTLQVARDRAFLWLSQQLQRLEKRDWFKELDCDLKAFQRQQAAILKGDFLEIQGAYQQIAEDALHGEIAAQNDAVDLLGAAKNTRAFRAADFSAAGHRKSSQDAGRDSVLVEPGNEADKAGKQVRRWARGLRLEERMDAVALLRRNAVLYYTLPGRIKLPALPFPPLHRVAADPWLQGARREAQALQRVRAILDDLYDSPDREALLLLSSPCKEPGAPVFPFDPSLLYDGGLSALERELERVQGKRTLREPIIDVARDTVQQLRAPVAQLHRARGVPSPYYALLAADGDGMGAILRDADEPTRTRLIGGLYEFADEGWRIIDEHGGCAFYVGGDELAAYLPVDQALAAADALQAAYKGYVIHPRASLSVGIVIAHVKEDLRATRGQAQAALKHAKDDRRKAQEEARRKAQAAALPVVLPAESWLCVDERPRGGSPRSCVAPTTKLRERIKGWVQALRADLVSMKTAHDLRTLKERYGDAERVNGGAAGLVLARAMAQQKAQRRDDGQDKTLSDEQRRRFRDLQSWDDVQQLINELLLAAHVNEISAQRGAEVIDV